LQASAVAQQASLGTRSAAGRLMSSTPAQSRAMFASQVHTSPSAAKRGTKLVLEAVVGTKGEEK